MLVFGMFAILGSLASASMMMKIYYSEAYDIKNASLEDTSCSDGKNGLISKHKWMTQEQVPDFPFIGGSSLIEDYDSSHCGECYLVTYGQHKTHMTGIDHAEEGLVMSKQGMDSLTGQQAEALGEVEAEVEVVSGEWCAIPR